MALAMPSIRPGPPGGSPPPATLPAAPPGSTTPTTSLGPPTGTTIPTTYQPGYGYDGTGGVSSGNPAADYWDRVNAAQSSRPDTTATNLAILQRMYETQAAPTRAGILGSNAIANARLPAIGAAFTEQSAALSRANAADRALLGLGRGDTNTRLAANARQPAYINALRGQDLRSLGLDMDRLNLTARRDTRLVKSDATARGAWNAPGLGRNLQEINEALFNSAGQVNIQREGVNTRANEQVASAADQRAMLQREASSYGLRAEQLDAQLQAGLARLNLDQSISVLDVMQMVNSGNTDLANLGRSILDQSINTLYQGTQQGTLPDLIAMLGGGAGRPGAGAPRTGRQ